ncbi:MAG: septum formation initiator family protein [Candidatus Kapabacteria bacterium]|nr:septum formation initiator family protein [Candidatus Kapabacteria bacterium]
MAKNPGLQVQKRVMTRKRIYIIGGMTFVVVAFVLFSPYGVITRLNLASEIVGLEKTTTRMRATEDSLRKTAVRLQTDSTEIERLARERYGYVRPGEHVFIIKRDTTK